MRSSSNYVSETFHNIANWVYSRSSFTKLLRQSIWPRIIRWCLPPFVSVVSNELGCTQKSMKHLHSLWVPWAISFSIRLVRYNMWWSRSSSGYDQSRGLDQSKVFGLTITCSVSAEAITLPGSVSAQLVFRSISAAVFISSSGCFRSTPLVASFTSYFRSPPSRAAFSAFFSGPPSVALYSLRRRCCHLLQTSPSNSSSIPSSVWCNGSVLMITPPPSSFNRLLRPSPLVALLQYFFGLVVSFACGDLFCKRYLCVDSSGLTVFG